MALYRTVAMNFWTDSKVVDDFTPEDRYFYLYLFTNPHTNLAGCYEISVKQAANELGYSPDSVRNLLDRFERVHDVIRFCKETKEVLIVNWHKYNWTMSEKFQKAVRVQIDAVKCEAFKAFLLDVLGGEDTVSIPYGYGMDITVTDTVTNTVSNSVKQEKKRFTPPTVEEVAAYCKERGNNVDPERFVDFYSAKGWKVGNQAMKDWRACVRTWEKRETEKPAVKKNAFNSFDQRKYSNGDLERMFLEGVR